MEPGGVRRDHRVFLMGRPGRNPAIRHRLGAIDIVIDGFDAGGGIHNPAGIGIDIFPDDFAGGRNLEEPADLAFVDEGIAVRQAPGVADMGAAEDAYVDVSGDHNI
jgi:hypothetical protein